MTPANAQEQRAILVLLVLSIFLNYIDRGSLPLAAPQIASEFHFTPQQMSSLFAAFFWTYSLLQLFGIAGWLADHLPVGSVLAWGLFLWAGATVATGVVSSTAALFAARLVLGAGESIAYPCYSRLLTTEIGAHHRGFANALLDAGSKLGPAVGAFLGGLLLAQGSWRVLFFVFGAATLMWLLPWWRWKPQARVVSGAAQPYGPSTWDILRRRSAWGAFLGHFCGNYFWFFLLTWLPTYLVDERHLGVKTMSRLSSLAYLLIAGATLVAGWLSDRWIRAGSSPTRVRKTIVVGGLVLSTVLLPVAIVNDLSISMTLLFFSCLGFGTYTSNHWAITQSLAGPLAAGRWTSLQNGVGNLSGVAASWLTGAVIEHTHLFPLAFVIAAGFALLSAVMWGVVVGPVEEQVWKRETVLT